MYGPESIREYPCIFCLRGLIFCNFGKEYIYLVRVLTLLFERRVLQKLSACYDDFNMPNTRCVITWYNCS